MVINPAYLVAGEEAESAVITHVVEEAERRAAAEAATRKAAARRRGAIVPLGIEKMWARTEEMPASGSQPV